MSSRNEAAPEVDPSLLRELEEAERGQRPLEAVLVLRRSHAGAAAPTPEQTERAVAGLLERAERATGERPAAVNVFRHLESFALAASPGFIRSLLGDRQIASARANRPGRSPER